MTINTETIRDAAEVLDTLTSALAVDHPLRTRAAARAKSCVSGLYSAADALDAQTAEIARLRTENAGLRISLRNMIGAYVRLMENGRDLIIDLGGQCDPVDVMEAADPWLRASRAALAQEQGGSDANGNR
ncbi:hypothetical protein GCM10009125_28060 [Castellaniella daejeonensis]|uniref:Uncharacterized protein n=1 Tax=Castellaniella daejeonensis TaxID=659013 RepID=A0ABN0U3M1_9BURK